MVDSLKQNLANFTQREITHAFKVMLTLAKSLETNNGVAAITIRSGFFPNEQIHIATIGTIYSPWSELDDGMNCMGLTMQKIAYMLRTGKNSGEDWEELKVLKGESSVKGGMCKKTSGGTLYVAFTGLNNKNISNPVKDCAIAKQGLESLLPSI